LRLDFGRVSVGFRRPFKASYGTLTGRELVQVTITDDAGVTGHGEAAPLEPYDGVGVERVLAALERYRTALARAGERSSESLLEACRAVDELPQALAAVDIALWDRAGRLRAEPVATLLCERLDTAGPPHGTSGSATDEAPDRACPLTRVVVNAVISATDRAGAAAEAATAVAAGFTCLKVKVGIGDDAGRLAAVRAAAGPDVALRVDANGVWEVAQAVRAIEALTPVGLELVEEPAHGLDAIRAVRERVSARIAIDESAALPGALSSGAADAVCLKISRCGGISGLLDAAAAVRASGAEPYLASTFDGPFGIAAAIHAAAALGAIGPLAACGLATLQLFEGIDDPLRAEAGAIAVPAGDGLGIESLIV
jgi:L-alanine-DL-glutamate epimerase-like enolase superfamily enzyme